MNGDDAARSAAEDERTPDPTIEEATTASRLMAFHARHKMEAVSHDPARARALGRIAAGATGAPFPDRHSEYRTAWDALRALPRSVGGHVNALQHLAGHIEDRASAQAMASEIEAYRRGDAPLAAVKRSLRARLSAAGSGWASAQSYLDE